MTINPGSQQTVRSFDPLQVFLIMLTVIFFGLTLYSILQQNPDFIGAGSAKYFSFKILNTESSASLFVTLLGALLVRNQFVLSLRPRISYKSSNILKEAASEKIWQVTIKNAGLGAAIIHRCEFGLETSLGTGSSSLLGYDEVIKRLAETGLTYESDFFLGNISKGFTFPPQEEYTAFELKTEHIQKIKNFTMLLHFQGFLGDRYHRTVVLIPKNFAKPARQDI